MCLVRHAFYQRSGVGEIILGLSAATLEQIAEVVGTPAYVYHADAIRDRYRELTDALAPFSHRICYSVKANSNLAVLGLLRSLGAGADIVSGGELERVLRAGFAGESIVFSGVAKTAAELAGALDAGVGLINVESRAELRELDRVAQEKDIIARFGIRVNPDVVTDTHPYTQTGERGMKFGVPMQEVLDLACWGHGREHLELRGIGMHIGSQITSAENYREGASKLAGLVADLRGAGVGTLQSVDVGGGLGIRYTDERALPAAEFAAAVKSLLEVTGLTLLVEPGRFLVGNAGVLLTRCVYRKKSGRRNFVVVDAGMNDFLRPSHYGAVHDIRTVSDSAGDPAPVAERCDVVGPICETGDFLGFERDLRAVGSGSLLAVLGAGAYGFTMSSIYNSRPRPAEVLIDGDQWAIVREREKVADLMRGEVLLGQAGLQWRTVVEGRG